MAEPERTPEAVDSETTSRAARLFDVRRVIGGLFVVYGVIVTIVGVFDNPAEIAKAEGVRINLWTGLAMLALGLLFLLWQWWRPAEAPSAPAPSEDERSGGGSAPGRSPGESRPR